MDHWRNQLRWSMLKEDRGTKVRNTFVTDFKNE